MFETTAQGMTVIRGVLILGVCVIVLLLIVSIVTQPSRGYAFEKQRTEQRKIVQERVKKAGGWAALRRECESLTNSTNYYFWHYQWDASGKVDYSALPPSLATLEPHEITLDPSATNVVQIELFGLHRTGGTDTPYYGLWFVCGNVPTNYTPVLTGGPARTLSKLEDGLFEVYQ